MIDINSLFEGVNSGGADPERDRRLSLRKQMGDVHDEVKGVVEETHSLAQAKRAELQARREAGEISPHDFDLNFIAQLNEMGEPLQFTDLIHQTGKQAVVISREQMEILGGFSFIARDGQTITVEPESVEEELILFPEELWFEEEGK